jgi:hypothetical protein
MTAEYTVMPSPEEQPNENELTAFFDTDMPAWSKQGVCAQTDPESFFPEKGGSTREAKRMCELCEVKQECLEYALDTDQRFGIWGGHSERERRRLKHAQRTASQVVSLNIVPKPSTSDERIEAMKDEARFPMVRAFLWKRQGQPFIVYGGDRGKLPGDLALSAKLDNVKELRQVLRKMGRSEADTKVIEDPDGTLWVELVKEETSSRFHVAAPLTVRIAEPIAPKPIVRGSIFGIKTREAFLVAEIEPEPELGDEAVEDLVFDSEVAPEQASVELELLEVSVDDINDELAAELQTELEAELAASSDELAAESIIESASIPTPREEIKSETIIGGFVEMEPPAGYANPAAPSSRLLYPTAERIFKALSWLEAQPRSIVRDQSITPEVQKILGVSSGAASSFVSHLVAEGLIGRVLNGKITRVTWLRQAGWDWLQDYAKGEATSTPAATTTRPKKQVAEVNVEKVKMEVNLPPISQAYDIYEALADWDGEGGASSDMPPTPPKSMEILRQANQLELAHDFKLDVYALVKCYAILGQRGSGKTSTGVVMAEEMIAQGWPVAIIDPQGVWYGIRSSTSGDEAGLPVIIFGGSHADIPLYGHDGYLLAELMETGLCSIIIDTSEIFDDEEMQGLMADFLTGLYHRKRRLPMHLIVDEADEIVPQSNFSKELITAATRITKRGRTRGIGSSWISQRPQDLNKKILTQAEVLIAMRLMHQLDIKAIEEWIGKNADASQSSRIRKTLASLPTGSGWFWSPAWMGDMELVNVRRRLTFDSSGTPLPGQFAAEPNIMAYVDLSILPQEFLDRLKSAGNTSAAYEEALDKIRALGHRGQRVIEDTPNLDEDDALEDIGGEPLAPAAIDAPVSVVEETPVSLPAFVSVLSGEEAAELIRLRAQIGAMTHVMTDALSQRDEANEELQSLHAEYRSHLVRLQGEIADLKIASTLKQTTSSNRVRELVEQVRGREIEVATLEALLLRHQIPVRSRYILAIVADEETA